MQPSQDWEQVVFNKKRPSASQNKDKKSVNAVSVVCAWSTRRRDSTSKG